MKRFIRVIQALAIGLMFLTNAAFAADLVLYTASNEQIEKTMISAFKEAYPDISVGTVNMSTGPVTERLIAEKANPQADVVWMLNHIALNRLKQEGVLAPYKPKNSAVSDEFTNPGHFWTGHNATIMAMAVNTKVLEERGLPMPTSWADLVKPVYEGQISVAAPTESGTGLSIASTFVDIFGWNFIENLDRNVFKYADSGSAPVRRAVSGEVAIGLSYDQAILQHMRAGAPIEMVTGDVSPNIIEGAGLIVNAPHPKAGRLFLDWLFSKDGGAAVLGPLVGISAVPGYGAVELSTVHLWEMRRPLDAVTFKRKWAKKFR